MFVDGMDDLVVQTGSSPQRAIPSKFVVITGLVVKSAFIGLANWALFAMSGPGSNALLYVSTFLAIGAFLTGLLVGYFVRGFRLAVLTGFLCALVPSLVFSFVVGQGSINPIGWLLFVLLFAPMDVLAIAGASFRKVNRTQNVWGSSPYRSVISRTRRCKRLH